jgi:hypothetical protein
MAEKNITEAAETLSNAVRESQQAIVDRTLAAHRQTAQVTQHLVEQGIEAARNQVEDNKSLLEELVRESQQPYKAAQAIINWTMAAQERNARLARRVLEQGMDVFKSQADSALALNQELVEQSQKQIAAWQTLAQASLDATVAFWSAPLSFYKETFEHQGFLGK